MKVFIHWDAKDDENLTPLLTACSWSGSRLQVARQLQFTFVQDDRDELVPKINIDCGYTIHGYDDDDNLVFVGNVYSVEKDRQKSSVTILARDHLHVLTRSKSTRKFTKALPEDIAAQICDEMGVIKGEFAKTGTPVSFIANGKTGYQIIMAAYTEAAKTTEKKYHPVMDGAKLDVIEKGTLIENFEAISSKNMTDSTYKKSIEKLINQVLILDENGNPIGYEKNDESIRDYSMFQAEYKTDPNKDTKAEVKKLMQKPEESGTIIVLGDYRVKSSYSITVTDGLFTGQFWVKSDTHTFTDGKHEMKLELEFENLMNEETAEQEKEKKQRTYKRKNETTKAQSTATKKTPRRKRKRTEATA